MGIKDIFIIPGIPNTMINRSYYEIYGAMKNKVDYVKNLLSLGAVTLRKPKMTAFTCSDEPTDQYIDCHAPSTYQAINTKARPEARAVWPHR